LKIQREQNQRAEECKKCHKHYHVTRGEASVFKLKFAGAFW
jgi:hypothetical protein